MYQVSAWSEYAFAFNGQKCKVCEMKKKKRRNYNEILLAYILGMADAICFKFGMWISLVGGFDWIWVRDLGPT